jgi:hypothetical protein
MMHLFVFCSGTKNEHVRSIMGYAVSTSQWVLALTPPDAQPVRLGAVECPLKGAGALRDRRFTAWRGRSGKRYIASVFQITDATALGYADAVLLAVDSDRQVLAARDSGPFGIEDALTRWRDAVRAAGAIEIHLHLLADDDSTRQAALADLMPVVAA